MLNSTIVIDENAETSSASMHVREVTSIVDQVSCASYVYHNLHNSPSNLAFIRPEILRDLSPETLSNFLSKVLTGLSDISSEVRRTNTESLKALADAELLTSIDPEQLNQVLKKALAGLNDNNIYIRLVYAEVIKVLKEAELLNNINEELLNHGISKVINGLRDYDADDDVTEVNQIDHAKALKVLIEAELLSNVEQDLLNQVIDEVLVGLRCYDVPIAMGNAEVLKALIEAGLLSGIDQKLLSQVIETVLTGLGHANCFLELSNSKILKALIEKGLLSEIEQELLNQIIKEVLTGLSDDYSEVRVVNSEALKALAVEHYSKINQELLDQVINTCLRGLIDDKSNERLVNAEAIKCLKQSGLFLDIDQNLLCQVREKILTGLSADCSFERRNNAESLKALKESGFFSDIDQELISQVIRKVLTGLSDDDVYIRRCNGETLKALKEAGLISNLDHALLNKGIEKTLAGLSDVKISQRIYNAHALKDLKEAGFLSQIDRELLDHAIEKVITDLCDNYSYSDVSRNNLGALHFQVIKVLNTAGLVPTSNKQIFQILEATSNDPRLSELLSIINYEHFISYTELVSLINNFDYIYESADLKFELTKFILQEKLRYQVPNFTIDKLATFFLSENPNLTRQELETKFNSPYFLYEISNYLANSIPRSVRKIVFEDGGDAICNFQEHLKEVFALPFQIQIQKPEDFPEKTKVNVTDIQELEQHEIQMLDGATHYGRTLVCKNQEICTAFKILKESEDLSILQYELDMMQYLLSNKDNWQLKGSYPKGIKLAKIPIDELSSHFDQNAKLQAQNWDISLKKEAGFCYALIYEADEEYFRYINDPTISEEKFDQAFEVSIHDRTILMSKGIIDTEIIELFHNQENDGGRLYDWMVDVRHHQQTRRGAGRLNNIPKSTLYPNIRLSGLADFASMYYLGDMIKDSELKKNQDNRIGRLMNHVDRNEQEATKFIWAAYYGDMLLSLSLMPATYLLRKEKLNYEHEKNNKDTWLKAKLKVLFGEQQGIDYSLMAEQMAFFMTGRYAMKDIPEHFYKNANVTLVREGRDGSFNLKRGWDINKGEKYQVPIWDQASEELTVTSFDLGPVNGPNPLQELIKALYYRATNTAVMLADFAK